MVVITPKKCRKANIEAVTIKNKVKCKGYDNSFNSWIDKKDLIK